MDIKQIKKNLETMVGKDPESEFYQRVGMPKFDNSGNVNSTAYTIGVLFGREAYLEAVLQAEPGQDASEEARQEVKKMLAMDVYQKITEGMKRLAICMQNSGWKDKQKARQFWDECNKYHRKAEDLKKQITHPTVLKSLRYQEALIYEQEHQKELGAANKGHIHNGRAGCLWALAGETDRAINYFNRAGPYSYPDAALTFEQVGDRENARAFWIKAAQEPQGYSDQIDEKAAECWLKAGNPEKALECYIRAADLWSSQEGSIDLHGDPKPGRDDAKQLRQNVIKPLKQRIKKQQKLKK